MLDTNTRTKKLKLAYTIRLVIYVLHEIKYSFFAAVRIDAKLKKGL